MNTFEPEGESESTYVFCFFPARPFRRLHVVSSCYQKFLDTSSRVSPIKKNGSYIFTSPMKFCKVNSPIICGECVPPLPGLKRPSESGYRWNYHYQSHV